MRKQIKAILMAMTLGLGGLAAALVHADTPPASDQAFMLQAPQKSFVVAFPKEGWVVNDARLREDGKGVFAQLTNSSNHLIASFFIEPADRCQTAEQCRDVFWQNPGPGYANATAVERLSLNGFAVLKCVVPFDNGSGADTGGAQQLNYSAHLVKNGYWLHIHVSKLPFAAADMQLLANFIDSLRIQ